MKDCPWCSIDGVCRSGDEATCDFKTIPMTKDGMKKRIDEEFKVINSLLSELKKELKREEVQKTMGLVRDKVMGIGIIRATLLDKFDINYFPSGRMNFLKTILSLNKYMRKFK